MSQLFFIDRIQIVSIIFSLVIFSFIFNLVKNRRMKEEYSLLWFIMSLLLLYLSLDRYAIDRLGQLFGIAYPPSVLTLMTTGFTFLLLIHLTVVITRLSDQNKEVIQSLALHFANTSAPRATTLVIVPAYNEEKNIVRVLEELHSLCRNMDLLVINDGSTDNTSHIARATGLAVVVDLQKNLGIGCAVQTGFKYARSHGYERAVQFDGDGQHIADEISKLIEPLEQNIDMVIGSRFLNNKSGYRSTFMRRRGIRLFQKVNSLLIGQKITDNTSGFRAYNRAAITFLAEHYPEDYPEPETVILLGKNSFTITEVDVQMRQRQGGRSSISGIKGGYYMVKVLLAILMTALRKPIVGKQQRN